MSDKKLMEFIAVVRHYMNFLQKQKVLFGL